MKYPTEDEIKRIKKEQRASKRKWWLVLLLIPALVIWPQLVGVAVLVLLTGVLLFGDFYYE